MWWPFKREVEEITSKVIRIPDDCTLNADGSITMPIKVTCKPYYNKIHELRHLGMLMQKPKYITVEARIGLIDPWDGFKAMYIGDKKIWTNPNYDEAL